MSVWREVQEALYQRFVAAWVGDDGEALTPIQLGNETFDPPEGLWVQLLVKRRAGGNGTLGSPGNRKMDRAGSVFILLREPPGKGVGSLSDAGERAAHVFENKLVQPHGIHFAEVEPIFEGDVEEGRWWGATIEGRFGYEELR